jgi:predicted negative regulator of RcsB-dependent stress response
MNKIVKLVLQAEREIMMKQVDAALKTASNIKAINDNIAMAWEIEGAAYCVKGDLAKAKVSWLRSLEIDPENPETTKMLGTIDEKLGTKK